MALLRVRLSVAAPAVDGTSSAARTHRSRERRAIEGYEQGRQPRVSVKLGGQAAQVPPGRCHSPLRYSPPAMGTVVKLEKPARQKSSGGKTPRRRPRRSRTALVLGGGGVTGGVYEI